MTHGKDVVLISITHLRDMKYKFYQVTFDFIESCFEITVFYLTHLKSLSLFSLMSHKRDFEKIFCKLFQETLLLLSRCIIWYAVGFKIRNAPMKT